MLHLFTSPVREATDTAPTRPWAPLLLAGGVAGIPGWLIMFPFDVFKTRIQAHDIVPIPVPVPVAAGSDCKSRSIAAWAVLDGHLVHHIDHVHREW
jgi:Mitochondrial carrier protein